MSKIKNTTFTVTGVCCADEEIVVRKKLNHIERVASFNFNIITQKLNVTHTCAEEEIIAALSSAGFKAHKVQYIESPKSFLEKYSNLLFTSVSGFLTLTGIVLNYFEVAGLITIPIFVTAIISGGWKIFIIDVEDIVKIRTGERGRNAL